MKLRKGDKVIVTSGKEKGKTGTIQKVLPKENKVIIDGINIVKKCQKPTQANPQGGIVEKFAPLNASKVAYYDEKTNKATKLGYGIDSKTGEKVRINKKSGKAITK